MINVHLTISIYCSCGKKLLFENLDSTVRNRHTISMETDQNTTPVASGERPLEPLSQRKYLKTNTSLPRLVEESEEEKEPYLKSLFRGRLNRRNYLLGTILILIVPVSGILILLLNSFLLTPTNTGNAPLSGGLQQNRSYIPDPTVTIPYVITPIGVLLSVLGTIIGLPFLASLQVRRLHDVGIGGKAAWLFAIPVLTPFMLFYLLLWPGGKGENRYGTQPSASIRVREDVFKLHESN